MPALSQMLMDSQQSTLNSHGDSSISPDAM